MAVLSTIPERCRRCYTCVRQCPAKAIKVEGGQAAVLADRCIACGNCVKVCAQKAKRVQDDTQDVWAMLRGDRPVFAIVAPSFAAAFDGVEPGRVVAAIRALGFAEVWEAAFGAELVAPEYIRLYKEARRTGVPVIATPCPAVVTFVEKFLPALHPYLAPVVSPKLAAARAIKQRHDGAVRVVFIGPCVAKKHNLHHPSVNGVIDAVLTFEELQQMWDARGLVPALGPSSSFDGPRAHIGRSFALSGGLLKTAGLTQDILENDVLVTEGKDRVLSALKDLAEGRSSSLFFDLLFCEGCIDGPKMMNDLSILVRRERMVDYIQEQARYTTQRGLAEALAEFEPLDLTRTFTIEDQSLPQPSEQDIQFVLAIMRKLDPRDQLDCGACGYPTCREKAIATCQGLAEPEMCLPYLVDELETTLQDLKQSHAELETTQKQLIKTERLASMGQLSAGIAHELNNPLGTILLYSHMLLKGLKDDPQARADVQTIVNEAVRCKEIVRGLLDFARKSRVSKAPTSLGDVLDEVVQAARPRADEAGVTVRAEQVGLLPIMMIDRTQVRQALVNLVMNGIDSITGGGTIRISARAVGSDARIEVTDTGCGIPQEHLSRIFTPFFTTKAGGKGTGLGLAITYGVIKMHSGDITVDSQLGKGTTFTIRLPVQSGAEFDGAREYKVEDQFFR